MHELNAILVIAHRDFTKLIRDRSRILVSFIFPFLFIGLLGGSLQANLAEGAGYNFLTFVFTGVVGQTLFQSTASGIISLLDDRDNDFSQEMFVSPISRYSIIFGKILGETLVSLAQLVGIIIFGLIVGVGFTAVDFVRLSPFFIIACLLGGGFGLFILAILSLMGSTQGRRTAEMAFPFVMFPQFFLAGVFSPIKILPGPLLIASRIAPMTYAVDIIRSVYYAGSDAYHKVVLFNTGVDIIVIAVMVLIFTVTGTFLFVRNERNR